MFLDKADQKGKGLQLSIEQLTALLISIALEYIHGNFRINFSRCKRTNIDIII